MAWTAPMTAVANSTFTAAQFNTHVRDNLNETAPAKATAAGRYFATTGVNSIAERELAAGFVVTEETTASTSYTDLASVGPSVTVTTSTSALVFLACQMENNTNGGRCAMSYAISGATSSASSDLRAYAHEAGADDLLHATFVHHVADLTPGSNVFKAEYRVTAGTGSFSRRRLIVMPF